MSKLVCAGLAALVLSLPALTPGGAWTVPAAYRWVGWVQGKRWMKWLAQLSR